MGKTIKNQFIFQPVSFGIMSNTEDYDCVRFDPMEHQGIEPPYLCVVVVGRYYSSEGVCRRDVVLDESVSNQVALIVFNSFHYLVHLGLEVCKSYHIRPCVSYVVIVLF